jgi:hypothetical protein
MFYDSKTGKMIGDLILPGDVPQQGAGDGPLYPNSEHPASTSEDDELSKILQSIAKISNLKFTSEIKMVHSKRVERWQMEEVLESGLGEPWMISEFCFDQQGEPWFKELTEKWGEGRQRGPPKKSPHGMDLLGAYIPSDRKIIIYDSVCRMVHRSLTQARERDLVSVVLAHEAAHAVTHLGEDLQGRIWDSFAGAGTHDVELFAQIYDLLHLRNESNTDLEKIFRQLADGQSPDYNSWRSYESRPIQEINDALIAARLKPPSPASSRQPVLTTASIADFMAKRLRPNLHPGTGLILGYMEEQEYRIVDPDHVWEQGNRVLDAVLYDEDTAIMAGIEVNTVPRRRKSNSACMPILVVAIGSKEGVDGIIQKAAKHISVDCPGATKVVIFWTTKWDSLKWIKNADSFQGTSVYLKLLGAEHTQLL